MTIKKFFLAIAIITVALIMAAVIGSDWLDGALICAAVCWMAYDSSKKKTV